MTDVTPLLRADQKIIQSYASGKFKISGEYFEGPIILTPFAVEAWSGEITPETFAKFKDEVDVLIIGTGKRGELLLPQKRAEFKQAGFSLELMDTGAACRTFNVLTAEGRRLAAALMPV